MAAPLKLTPFRLQVLRALNLGHSGEMVEGKTTIFHLSRRILWNDPCPECGLQEYRNIDRPARWLIDHGFVYDCAPYCLTRKGKRVLKGLVP